MERFDPTSHPHRRCKCHGNATSRETILMTAMSSDNPLTNIHVLVSPHRTKRPWLGQTEPAEPSNLPEYDPACYLCPGNTRAGGKVNKVYTSTMVFENDYGAVLPPPGPVAPQTAHPLLSAEPIQGGCDVVCFHPRHDLSLPTLSLSDVENIVDEWISVYMRRGTEPGIKYVQIFEVLHCYWIIRRALIFNRTKVQ